MATKDLIERRLEQRNHDPHAVLGDILAKLNPIEARLILVALTGSKASYTPQLTLRDAASRLEPECAS